MTSGPPERAPEHYWLDPGLLAAGEWPGSHLDWLAGQNISLVINLTDREYHDKRFRVHCIPVPDGAAPGDGQIRQLCRLVQREVDAGRTVYVHCMGGCGRTGTMMACYLVYRHRLDPMEAIQRLRDVRPCSVETAEQADAVIHWSRLMQARDYRL